MVPIPRDEFAGLVRGLEPPAFARFVADVWRARGREVALNGDVLVATDPVRGTTERILLHHDPHWLRSRPLSLPRDERIDGVVTTGRGLPKGLERTEGDVDVVDVDALRLIALYAIDRDRGDELFRTYLDRSRTVDEPGTYGRLRGKAKASPGAAYAAVGAFLALFVVIGAIGGGAVFGPSEGDTAAAGPSSSGSLATPAPTRTTAAGGGGEAFGESVARSSEDSPYPPGLSKRGITDAMRLASAHARAISGRSYRLEIRHYELVDRELRATVSEEVRVEAPTRYAAEIRATGTTEYDPLVISGRSSYAYGYELDERAGVAEGDVYANGTARYERRIDDGVVRYERWPVSSDHPEGGEGRYADRVERYLEWFFSVKESRIAATDVRDGERYFWVTWTGDTYSGIRNTTGIAVVDSSGVVHQARRSYRFPDSDRVSVVVTIEYEAIGNTTVEPPAWLPDARNGTRRAWDAPG